MSFEASQVDAVVVGGIDYGDADRVVHCIGPQGRIAAFAPSARRSRRRFGAALQAFTSVRLALGRRRRGSELVTLSSAEIRKARLALARDLERLALAAYLGELSFQLAPEGVPSDLCVRLETTLDALERDRPSIALRRAYEIRLTAEHGTLTDLEGCVVCAQPGAFLDLERGGLFCRSHHRGDGREIGPKTRAWLSEVLRSTDVTPLGLLSPEDAERAARAAGPSVDRALEAWIERPLASRRLLAEVGL